MVGDLSPAVREVEDLAGLDAGDLGAAQVPAAAAASGRRMVDDPVGLGDALEVGARSAGLLSLVALALLPLGRLAAGLALGLVVSGGRQRRVLGVLGQLAFQLEDASLQTDYQIAQLGVLRLQFRSPCRQVHDDVLAHRRAESGGWSRAPREGI